MIPNILSIAGSDPSGGAGIQADLKTFGALRCHGMAAITALTAQNTVGVRGVHLPPASFIADQIEMVFADVDVAAVKIGMLGSGEIVAAVASALRPHLHGAHGALPVVLDPVLVATSGAALGDESVVNAMRAELFPFVTLVTPNIAETMRLGGGSFFANPRAIEDAARILRGTGAAAWLIKGGHGDTATADDYLLGAGEARWFSSPRVATANTHGTGCTLSSAIAAFLAKGHALAGAVGAAKSFVDAALAGADHLSVGKGPGPLDHFAKWR